MTTGRSFERIRLALITVRNAPQDALETTGICDTQSRMETIRVNHVPAPRLTTVETINPTCTSTRPTQLN